MLQLTKAAMPPGNMWPPSLHIIKGILSCEKAESFEQHVCEDDCMRFVQLPRSQWKQHRFDKCTCGKRRFVEKHNSAGSLLLAPAKVSSAPTNLECAWLVSCRMHYSSPC